MGESKYKLTLGVNSGTADIWRHAALALGYKNRSGPQVGQGSIAQLMRAMAGGDLSSTELERALTLARDAGAAEVGAAMHFDLKS
jgi:hypothetical protein